MSPVPLRNDLATRHSTPAHLVANILLSETETLAKNSTAVPLRQRLFHTIPPKFGQRLFPSSARELVRMVLPVKIIRFLFHTLYFIISKMLLVR